MKKHDEGYVMILVLVVMIVMGLVTASILTFSLRNLQNQQLSIERMADKYAAQGEIEKYLAVTDNKIVIKAETNQNLIATNVVYQPEDNQRNISGYVEFDIKSKHNGVVIDCTVKVFGAVSVDNANSAYTVTNPEITYTSYKITYSNGETEEEVPAT